MNASKSRRLAVLRQHLSPNPISLSISNCDTNIKNPSLNKLRHDISKKLISYVSKEIQFTSLESLLTFYEIEGDCFDLLFSHTSSTQLIQDVSYLMVFKHMHETLVDEKVEKWLSTLIEANQDEKLISYLFSFMLLLPIISRKLTPKYRILALNTFPRYIKLEKHVPSMKNMTTKQRLVHLFITYLIRLNVPYEQTIDPFYSTVPSLFFKHDDDWNISYLCDLYFGGPVLITNPNHLYYFMMGNIYNRLCCYQEAIQCFHEAYNLNPQFIPYLSILTKTSQTVEDLSTQFKSLEYLLPSQLSSQSTQQFIDRIRVKSHVKPIDLQTKSLDKQKSVSNFI